jgi:hypothetical protein
MVSVCVSPPWPEGVRVARARSKSSRPHRPRRRVQFAQAWAGRGQAAGATRASQDVSTTRSSPYPATGRGHHRLCATSAWATTARACDHLIRARWPGRDSPARFFLGMGTSKTDLGCGGRRGDAGVPGREPRGGRLPGRSGHERRRRHPRDRGEAPEPGAAGPRAGGRERAGPARPRAPRGRTGFADRPRSPGHRANSGAWGRRTACGASRVERNDYVPKPIRHLFSALQGGVGGCLFSRTRESAGPPTAARQTAHFVDEPHAPGGAFGARRSLDVGRVPREDTPCRAANYSIMR